MEVPPSAPVVSKDADLRNDPAFARSKGRTDEGTVQDEVKVNNMADTTTFGRLRGDGPRKSAGSVGHPDHCTPCAFYCFAARGCRNNVECDFCHLWHESKLQQRRAEWKQTQRAKRVARKCNVAVAEEGEEEEGESEEIGTSSSTRALTGDDSSTQKSDNDFYISDPKLPMSRVAVNGLRKAGAGTSARGGDAAFNSAAPPQLPLPCQPGSVGSRPWSLHQGHGADVHGVRPAPGLSKQALSTTDFTGECELRENYFSKLPEPKKVSVGVSPSEGESSHFEDLTADMAMLGCLVRRHMERKARPTPDQPSAAALPTQVAQHLQALANMPNTRCFSYVPDQVIVSVGQQVELSPLDRAFRQTVFATSPELPWGLQIDHRTGVVFGRPQVGTDSLLTFFVAACMPGQDIPHQEHSLHISFLSIKVVEAPAPWRLKSSGQQAE